MTQFKHPEDVFLARIQKGESLDCVHCELFNLSKLNPWCHEHKRDPRQGKPICPDFKYKRK